MYFEMETKRLFLESEIIELKTHFLIYWQYVWNCRSI
jgi:hypothetical protein